MPNRERDTRNAISSSIGYTSSSSSNSNSRTNSPFEYINAPRIARGYPLQLHPPISVQHRPRLPRELSLASPLTAGSLPTPAFTASAVLTDIGICVRMQNVHLTNIHHQPLAMSSSILASSKKQFNHQHQHSQVNPPNVLISAKTSGTMILNNNQNLNCDTIPSCCNSSKFQNFNDIIMNGETFVVSDFSNKQKSPNCMTTTVLSSDYSNKSEMALSHMDSINCSRNSVPIAVKQTGASLKNVPGLVKSCGIVGGSSNKNDSNSRQSSLAVPPFVYQQQQEQQPHQNNLLLKLPQHPIQNGFHYEPPVESIAETRLCKKDKNDERRDDPDILAAPPPKKKWIRHYLMEEPCRNGEHPITSPSSYLLISANKETDSSVGTTIATTTTHLSKQDNRATGCDSFLPNSLNCKKIISNGGNKIEINNKCLSNNNNINGDHMLPLLRPTSSSPAFSAGYPTDTSRIHVPTPRSPVPYAPPSKIKKPTPLTPPPTSNRKFVEKTRTRSSSLSSTNFTANVSNSNISNGSLASTTAQSSTGATQSASIGAISAISAASASEGASLIHSRIVAANGHSGTEDSSHSSLNLSSSGYLSGSSANSSVGVSSSLSNLNISNSSTSSLTSAGLGSLNGYGPNDHQLVGQGSARRRTISTNSSGGKQRSPCILRAGTREVHNKLEKHRRAHLKECFEQLKAQLQLRDEEKKKTSNLAILGAAFRHVMTLKKKERELEQQVEQLAKEKINYQKRILSLKRELSSKHDNFDFPSLMSDADISMVKEERDSLSDTLSAARGCARYSSSSSLSSTITVPSPSGSNNMLSNSIPPHAVSPPVIMPTTSLTLNASPSPSNHLHTIHLQHLPKSISPVNALGNSVPLPLTTKMLQSRCSPTPSTPSPSSSSMNGIPPSSPIVSSSASPSSTSTSSLCASPPIIVPQSPLGALAPSSNAPTSVPISLKNPHVPNGVKVPLPGSIISSTSPHIPPSSSPLSALSSLSSSASLSIISSTTNNPLGLSLASVTSTSATSSPPVLNYTTNEHNSILSAASLATATSLNSGMPLNLNASASPPQVQILHAAVAKDLSGKNGICRKVNDLLEQSSISTSLVATPTHHQQSYTPASIAPVSEIVVTNNASTTTITTKDKMPEDSEQPKFINVLNGLVLSQFPMFAASPQSLRMLGTGGLATIELSTSQVQSQSRNHSLSSPTSTATPTTGAQLHKLLVSGTTVSTSSGPNTTNVGNGLGGTGGSSSSVAATAVASELARLPGGAEVNLLSRNGKMTIVNNGITLKGADVSNTRAAMHVVAPLQSGGASISRLAPLVVSQGKMSNNLSAHLLAPSSQLTRQVNLSVGGQLPIISAPYLTSPMVVAVASNQTQPTLSSVPPTATSVAVATATANGSLS